MAVSAYRLVPQDQEAALVQEAGVARAPAERRKASPLRLFWGRATSDRKQRVPVIVLLWGRIRANARSPLLDLHQANVVFATSTAMESIRLLPFFGSSNGHLQCAVSRISKVRLHHD